MRAPPRLLLLTQNPFAGGIVEGCERRARRDSTLRDLYLEMTGFDKLSGDAIRMAHVAQADGCAECVAVTAGCDEAHSLAVPVDGFIVMEQRHGIAQQKLHETPL